jgi:N utilization substance protein B
MMERRRARQIALEILYQIEVGGVNADEALANRQRNTPTPDFSFRIIKGVTESLEAIDSTINECAEHWTVDRMPIIDRNIIRMAVYEMLKEGDIPFSVSINEAVEIAKKYGTEDSGKFVNGVVAKIAVKLRSIRKQR